MGAEGFLPDITGGAARPSAEGMEYRTPGGGSGPPRSTLSGAGRPDAPAQSPLPRGGYRAAPSWMASRQTSRRDNCPAIACSGAVAGAFQEARHPHLVAHALRIAAERLA